MKRMILLPLLLFSGCITGERLTDYRPHNGRVFELGQETAIARMRTVLGPMNVSKPDIDPGTLDITGDYLYLSASRGPIPSVRHKVTWGEELTIKVLEYVEPGVAKANWIHDVRLETTGGKELVTIRFLNRRNAHDFADLCASFQEAKVRKGG